MKLVKASTAVLVALGLSASAGASALACDWHEKQVQAKVSTPVTDEQVDASAATPVDPVQFARSESPGEAELPKQE